MDYILRYEEPNYALVLSHGKNNTQAFSQTTLWYLYSIAQIWVIQISNMSYFLNSKHFLK